jgi:hypothetical protein
MFSDNLKVLLILMKCPWRSLTLPWQILNIDFSNVNAMILNTQILISPCTDMLTNLKQAMPQLTDRSKLPNIIDPVIRDTMDQKHLYQVQ